MTEIEKQGDASQAAPAAELALPRPQRLAAAGCKGSAFTAFEEVFSFEHLLDSARECCSGVRWKASTQTFEQGVLLWVSNIKRQLHDGSYRSKGFNDFTICERGKWRKIQSVHISERMVQKCLVKYCLRPLVAPKLIYDNHATLPGHGTELALKRLREHLRWWYARHGRDGGVLVMDYRDYFASIDHAILKAMYRELPMDDRLYGLTCYFIDCFSGGRGLGLGSEISQISAVFYVSGVDHMVKDGLGFHCYGRYMDDSYLIGGMDELRRALGIVEAESSVLGLQMNPKATGIRRLDKESFAYLKKRIMLTESGKIVTRLDRANAARERKRLKRNAAMVACGSMTRESEEQSWQSWKAHASSVNAHATVRRMELYRESLLLGF